MMPNFIRAEHCVYVRTLALYMIEYVPLCDGYFSRAKQQQAKTSWMSQMTVSWSSGNFGKCMKMPAWWWRNHNANFVSSEDIPSWLPRCKQLWRLAVLMDFFHKHRLNTSHEAGIFSFLKESFISSSRNFRILLLLHFCCSQPEQAV